MLALLVGVAGLFVGPALLGLSRSSAAVRAGVDGLAVTLVLGACVLWLLPHAIAHGGWWGALGIALGATAPIAIERLGASSRWAGLGLALFAVHEMLDGAALAVGEAAGSGVMALGVAAHRIPLGMAVAYRSRSQAHAALALGAIAGLTVLGYALGSQIPALLPEVAHAAMEGVVAGVLLHVVLGHPAAEPLSAPIPLE